MNAAATKIWKNSGEMNVAQAAEYLGLSVKRLYNVLHERQGPRCIKRSGRLYFLAADLDAWQKARTTIRRAFS